MTRERGQAKSFAKRAVLVIALGLIVTSIAALFIHVRGRLTRGALQVGMALPSCFIQTEDKRSVDLIQLIANQSAVIIFVRPGCSHCRSELEAVSQVGDLLARVQRVAVVEPDSTGQSIILRARAEITCTI